MSEITTVGLDLAKNVLQVHRADASGRSVLRKKLRRAQVGERSLRRLLIIGADSVIIKRHVHAAARAGTWLSGMLTRKPPMLV